MARGVCVYACVRARARARVCVRARVLTHTRRAPSRVGRRTENIGERIQNTENMEERIQNIEIIEERMQNIENIEERIRNIENIEERIRCRQGARARKGTRAGGDAFRPRRHLWVPVGTVNRAKDRQGVSEGARARMRAPLS